MHVSEGSREILLFIADKTLQMHCMWCSKKAVFVWHVTASEFPWNVILNDSNQNILLTVLQVVCLRFIQWQYSDEHDEITELESYADY